MFCPLGRLKSEWLGLITRYPDRFLIGSDEFFLAQTSGKKHPSAGSTENTVGFLALLPRDIARQVGSENAHRLFHLTP